MPTITIGDIMPSFTKEATNNIKVKSSDLKNKKVILYFYPRDNTPGCTIEGLDFKKHHEKFLKENAIIYGVSRDPLKRHESFKQKKDFPFELISDEDSSLCEAFGVIVEKNMFGKKVQGIQRSTFLFDEKGILRQEWRKVNIKNHVEEVLKATKAI